MLRLSVVMLKGRVCVVECIDPRRMRPDTRRVTECPSCAQINPDGFRFCGACGTALDLVSEERRRLVTLLFCDVSGSTAIGERLDPEAVRELMFRYFHTMRDAIERHDGTVEKFIGDAVMAVFGVPAQHEDDALRAVRAAAEMRERMTELNVELDRSYGATLALRIGVNTGEAVVGTETVRQAMVTGDAVNLAARLEQAAMPGEILIGPLTHRLVSHAADCEPTTPLTLKGKAQAVQAFRLLRVKADAPRPLRSTPLVGRATELAMLQSVLTGVAIDGRARLVTVVGEAGVGKSRLIGEVVAQAMGSTTVLRGRCLPYGDGITYWPLAEMLRQAAQIRDEDDPSRARSRVHALVLGAGNGAAAIALRLLQAVGLSDGAAPAIEVGWAARRLVEIIAERDGRPVLVTLDDLQWSEPALLDLVAAMATAHAPVTIIATARPEVAETHTGWRADIGLGALTDEAGLELVGQLIDTTTPAGADLARRVAIRAGGNPLFAEELVAMVGADEAAEVEHDKLVIGSLGVEIALPDSLGALLGERLDRMPTEERHLLECGAVEGEVFHRGAATALLDGNAPTAPTFARLIAREIIRPERAAFVDEAAYRFRHILVRDSAYANLSKRARVRMHARFAEWLRAHAGDREAEYEAVLGYHLEQAYRYRISLGPADPEAREIGRRAATHLHGAARRANRLSDPAAGALLTRSLELAGDNTTMRTALLIEQSKAVHLGAERRLEILRQADELAVADGDESQSLESRIREIQVLAWTDPLDASSRRVEIATIVRRLRELGDDARLAMALVVDAEERFVAGRSAEALHEVDEGIERARHCGDDNVEEELLERRMVYSSYGAAHARDTLEAVAVISARPETGPSLRGTAAAIAAIAQAMLGDGDGARRSIAEGIAIADDVGLPTNGQTEGMALWIMGEPERAAFVLREGLAMLEAAGNVGMAVTNRAVLAEAMLSMGDSDGAMEAARMTLRDASPDDVSAVVPALGVRAEVLALRDERVVALQAAAAVISAADATDWWELRGEARLHVARIHSMLGDGARSRAIASEAVEWFERKGNASFATVARELAG